MNKLLLLVVSVLCTSAQAQTKAEPFTFTTQKLWYAAARVGYNSAWITGEPRPSYEKVKKGAIYLGLAVDKVLTPYWAIESGLYYSPQGYTLILDDATYGHTIREQMGYFTLPVLVKLISPVRITCETGFQVGLQAVKGDESSKLLDASWIGGLSYLNKEGFGVEVSYILGLGNIWKAGELYGPMYFGNGVVSKNRVIQGGFIYYFAAAEKRPGR